MRLKGGGRAGSGEQRDPVRGPAGGILPAHAVIWWGGVREGSWGHGCGGGEGAVRGLVPAKPSQPVLEPGAGGGRFERNFVQNSALETLP